MKNCILVTVKKLVFVCMKRILIAPWYKFSPSVVKITPRFLLLIQLTHQTTCSCVPEGWRVALLLLHMPSTFHTSQHLTHLFDHFQKKEKKKFPVCGPLSQTHAHIVCQRMWLKHNNSFYLSHGWFLRTQLFSGPLLILCRRCYEWRYFMP